MSGLGPKVQDLTYTCVVRKENQGKLVGIRITAGSPGTIPAGPTINLLPKCL